MLGTEDDCKAVEEEQKEQKEEVKVDKDLDKYEF